MSRVYNFSAGPATLPLEVLQQVQDELFDWQGTGVSEMEISHHSAQFLQVMDTSEADLRELLTIPDNYKVLFLQGGGRSQFSMVPMNLLWDRTTANYLETGTWSKLAITEASRYCDVNIMASSVEQKYTTIPEQSAWKIDNKAAYLYYVDNETVDGNEFDTIPKGIDMPLVCDMSSNFLSREFDITRFGLVFAAAQKNVGIAGVTIVVVREDLLGGSLPITPTMFNYKVQADAHSLYNTAPTFSWYVTGLVLQWLKRQGGIAAIEKINRRKADKLYQAIDNSGFYVNSVDKRYRSRMNVVFRSPNENLDQQFITESKAAGLSGLKGHKITGGMRASIYNAMPEAGVDALIDFMQDFQKQNG